MVRIKRIPTSTFYDPWILPHSDEIESYRTTMPLTHIETSYDAIQSTKPSVDSDPGHLIEAELD